MALKKRDMAEKEWEKHCKEKNKKRVKDAKDTLLTYRKIKDSKDLGDMIELEDIIDLLTDLRHYAKANDLSYNDADRIAFNHFEAETHGEE